MKVAIVLFPGTNCEQDTKYAFELLGCETEVVWHKQDKISADLVVLPGGFSYGDYLRTAAIAKFSPIMKAVLEHAKNGGYILGICNGFQMLLELSLLDGAMRRNESMNFISKYHKLKVVSNKNKFLSNCIESEILNIPVAHGEGNYFTDQDTLKKLYDNEQVLLKYCDDYGNEINPNGSIDFIAGICDKNKKIFGLMPHPERACDLILGSDDGLKMLKGLVC
ncbi:phosphoribosylformylglycinamidine synthase subunit PurQ [Campylobacter pinnipediorum]|uniref:Phosphoribosylformylglycinamidine synthase subunit PurQ n=1 Tax=Campylobacter pinnipediorum subsp. pinnipediorum TaxID=1660067 RepID=A0AAX0LBN3_9BACT|nr:phosphoribosylformylglycinamidine synthase subunit PurQ [Campylobacter pinnipediorum]AQW81110.1 phosphoribosylformylglycinamidine synthase PurLQS, glutaminase subunit PurQ [Campylobacter pinnipediorum subsp. pinnipediorum]AQW82728.1 phosphoribosylformylglycinamidine synthase PurLQS, glutaminase subunit PurQ [Campylobacter pinnipediorum subsp. pinnipediorum]AQW84415.1 phosphoribosylformylglycinamidine synthase PurLQS, glutaminase subunit PurQ [Campylobacter pinnipediorum subsp. pinnipediorum]